VTFDPLKIGISFSVSKYLQKLFLSGLTSLKEEKEQEKSSVMEL
jgi:hypothetical protein